MKPKAKYSIKGKSEKVRRKVYTEENLQKALKEVGKGMSKRLAAKTFQVPRATLQFRLNHPEHKSKPGPSTVLTPEEEQVFINWIKVSSRKGFPKRKEDLIKSVSEFLQKSKRPSSFKNGEKWFKLFLARHPTLVFRTPEAVTAASSTVSEDDVRGWFRQIKDYLVESNLFDILSDPGRILNGDETNFVLCPKTGLVLSSKGDRNVYEIDHAQAKTSLTVMFTFCADGNLTPPVVIYPYKRLPGEITSQIPEDWGVGLSENGWMNSDIFYEYIKNVLYPYLVKIRKQFPIILFVDGHKSHLTLAVSELCTSLQIVLIALYPNCTRLLQPADVAAFKPLKTEWQKTVIEWRRTNPSQALTKTQFIPLMKNTIERSLKPQTIVNGFRATGLYPWDENAVDYSKCLGVSSKNKSSSQVNNKKICSKVLTYDEFVNLVGENKINTIATGELTFEESIQYLKKIWNFFSGKSEELTKLDSQDRTSDIVLDIRKEDSLKSLDIQNMEVIFNGSPNRAAETQASNIELISQEVIFDEIIEPSNETKDMEYSCQEPCFETVTHRAQINYNPDATENIAQGKDKCIQFISKTVVGLPTDTNTAIVNIPKKAITLTNLTPVKLNDILVLPKTPQRKGVKNSVKTPFVLTSAGWQAKENEKIRIKQEKAEGIKKRKEERERKKLEKEQIQKVPKKPKKKTKDDVVKFLLSKDFYTINTDAVIENIDKESKQQMNTDKEYRHGKENKQQMNIDEEYRHQKINSNKNYTTAELEKILTDFDY